MSIITNAQKTGFDSAKVKKGDFIRAKYKTWGSAHNGLVAGVNEKEIRILYIPEIGNVTNYFVIPVTEVENGLWKITISADLITTETEGDENDV